MKSRPAKQIKPSKNRTVIGKIGEPLKMGENREFADLTIKPRTAKLVKLSF